MADLAERLEAWEKLCTEYLEDDSAFSEGEMLGLANDLAYVLAALRSQGERFEEDLGTVEITDDCERQTYNGARLGVTLIPVSGFSGRFNVTLRALAPTEPRATEEAEWDNRLDCPSCGVEIDIVDGTPRVTKGPPGRTEPRATGGDEAALREVVAQLAEGGDDG